MTGTANDTHTSTVKQAPDISNALLNGGETAVREPFFDAKGPEWKGNGAIIAKGEALKNNLIQTSEEFAANFLPPEYLIDGLVQRRFIYALTGPTGTGKTCVAIQIAAHCALGKSLDGREVEKVRVLFFAGENPDDVRMRWIKQCEEMSVKPSKMEVFFLPGTPRISDEEIRGRIDAEAAQHGPFGLLIVDTSAAYFSGDDENSNAQLGAHARMLRSFVNLPGGPSIIVTCHPIKNYDTDNLLPRGGGAFLNEVDGNLVLIKKEASISLHWHGKFRGPDFAPIPFKLQTGTTDLLKDSKGRYIWSVSATPITEAEQAGMEDAARKKQDDLLVWLLVNTYISLANTAEKLGWKYLNGQPDKTSVNRALAALLKDKLIGRKRGKITVTEAGKKAVKAGNKTAEDAEKTEVRT